jgi:hypothetical protein
MEEHGLYVETTCRQKEAILQEILKDPEITIGIFSHTKPTANKALRTYSVVSTVIRTFVGGSLIGSQVSQLAPLRDLIEAAGSRAEPTTDMPKT